jgi:5-formyltetrahydrofolate cyclo-ligase
MWGIRKMKTKAELRQTFRHLLEGDAGVESGARSTELCEQLVQYFKSEEPKGHGPRVWAAYQPTGFEANIREALSALASVTHSVVWVFPRVLENGSLKFFRPHAPSNFSLNQWGILEPDPAHSDEINSSEIEGLLIPALAFDLELNRLGRGKGFYDRALAEILLINPHVTKIGVALDRQISNELFPTESFDIPMDLVITESRKLRRRSPELHTERKSS